MIIFELSNTENVVRSRWKIDRSLWWNWKKNSLQFAMILSKKCLAFCNETERKTLGRVSGIALYTFRLWTVCSAMILVSIWYRVLAIRRSSSWMPIGLSSFRPNSNETGLPNFKSMSENINENRVILHPKWKQKRKRSDYPWQNFSLYAWIFPFSPPFLGIDHLENVLIQY